MMAGENAVKLQEIAMKLATLAQVVAPLKEEDRQKRYLAAQTIRMIQRELDVIWSDL